MQVGPEVVPGDTRNPLNGDHSVGRDFVPLVYRGTGNSEGFRQLWNTTNCHGGSLQGSFRVLVHARQSKIHLLFCQVLLGVTRKLNSANVNFMQTLGQKIKAARLAAGMIQPDLAEKLGVTRNAVSLWESDKNGPSLSTLMKLVKLIPLEIDGMTSVGLVEPQPAGLPIMGEVRAGAWLEIDNDVEVTGHIPVAPDRRYRGQRQYALKVVGTSMNKVAQPGIFVIVADWTDNGADLKDGDLVVVRRERAHTYEVTLKRARKAGASWEFWPESDDPRHQEPIRPSRDNLEWTVAIVGKVIGKYEPL